MEPAPSPALLLELGSCPRQGAFEQHHAAVLWSGLDPDTPSYLSNAASLPLQAGMDGSQDRSGKSLLRENPLWQWRRNLEQKASIFIMPCAGTSEPVGSGLCHAWGCWGRSQLES